MPPTIEVTPPQSAPTEARTLRELTPQQWKSGLAAWLGWFFDGLELHLYTLVAAPFVMQLLGAASVTDQMVREKSSWIQAAFLVGWALGGGFFGRIGDRLGRSRALALTVLTYAVFTGISFFAHTWWQLLIFRFLAALGIGGEWAVGAALLAETWPKAWRPWIAATLQCGVNFGILLACGAVAGLAALNVWATHAFGGAPTLWGWLLYPRCVFLVGVIPAVLVWWLRRSVPETEEWKSAQAGNTAHAGLGELFTPRARRTTLLCMLVCAASLTGWWAFMFWHPQHIRNLPELATWQPAERDQLVTRIFAVVVGVSVLGNFFAGWLAKRVGYRWSIALMFAGMGFSMAMAHLGTRSHESLMFWYGSTGFFSGVFGLFTMYLPPLFPTLVRTTGAGFCYNIGRIAAAWGTVYFGLYAKVGDFRTTLLWAASLFVPAMLAVLLMPEPGTDGVGEPID
ncbi:MFS transporter [Verrucomicrobiota bacterium sgz303538]